MRTRITSRRGFTLVEVLISATLAGTLMAAVLSSYVFLGRNLTRVVSYQSLENESRKALGYLRKDFALAQSVKNGTIPTSSTVTLVLPAGEVTYTYDSGARRLRRQANFGPNPDFYLLFNGSCECTTFTFSYFTAADGTPTDQGTPGRNVPYSIKQIQARFVIESPAAWASQTRARFEGASSRFLFRNKGAPDGT